MTFCANNTLFFGIIILCSCFYVFYLVKAAFRNRIVLSNINVLKRQPAITFEFEKDNKITLLFFLDYFDHE